MLVYNVANEKSFNNIRNYMKDIQKVSTVIYALTCDTRMYMYYMH